MTGAPPSDGGVDRATVCVLLPLLILVAVVSRLWGLDYQAFHHDESIHSKAIWDLARRGPEVYRYDPVFHGPLFYNLGALASSCLPDTEFVARLPFAMAGLVLAAGSLLLVPVAGWRAALLLLTLVTVSPTITYYSRFAREDVVMTALLAWTIGCGALYLRTRRLRWLTMAWVCIVLAYCNKESSYIHGFLLCSFLVLWGTWICVRTGACALRSALARYLPLVRLLIVYGCFSFFVFGFVAIDSRVGPETPLLEGLTRVGSSSITLDRPGNAAVIADIERGYFTAQGRESLKRWYVVGAFSLTALLMTAAELVAMHRRRLVFILPTLVGYAAAAWWLAQFGMWAASFEGGDFLQSLRSQLIGGALLYGGLPVLCLLPPLHRGWRVAARAIRPALRELWALAFQVMVALLVYCVLFSSWGTNAGSGLRAGMYDYIAYWFRQQTGEYRIWGEWWYYLPRLALYEAAPIVVIVLCGWSTLRRRGAGAALWFSLWLAGAMVGIYALLNEKVGWLSIYQAYALCLLASLVLARWIESAVGRPRLRAAMGFGAVAALAFACWQHALAVHLFPDAATEPMAFVTTSRQYLEVVRAAEQDHWRALEAGRQPPRISLSGEAVWPAAWYLRRANVTAAAFARDAQIQFMNDTEENRVRLDYLGEYEWEKRAVRIRGWWFAQGEGLPGGGSLPVNIAAALLNVPNDHSALPGAPPDAPVRFGEQLLSFVLLRTAWYPETGTDILVARRTNRQALRRGKPIWLEGLDRTPRRAEIVEQMPTNRGLKSPRALAILPGGELAVADSGNGRVCLIDKSGGVASCVGEGILNVGVTGPCGLAAGAKGVLYVADTWHHALRAFSRDGSLLATRSSASPDPMDALYGPRGIAVSSLGRVYATDTGNCRVVALDESLSPLFTWGGPGKGAGTFDEPVGIAVDAAGNVFVADTGNGKLQQFDANGVFLREFQIFHPAPHERLAAEPQLAVLPDGERIAVTYATRNVFLIISPRENRAWPWQPAVAAEPSGIAFAADWGVYLSDRRSGAILRLSDGREPAP